MKEREAMVEVGNSLFLMIIYIVNTHNMGHAT